MNRIRALVNLMKAVPARVGSAWEDAEYRKTVTAAMVILLLTWLVAGVSLSDGGPLIDATNSTTTAASAMLDAAGFVHVVDSDGHRVVQPDVSISSENMAEPPVLVTFCIGISLVWAAWAGVSFRQSCLLICAGLAVAGVSHVLGVFLVALVAGSIGWNLSIGPGLILGFAVMLLLGCGLQFCLIQTIDRIRASYRYQQYVRNPNASSEEPLPVPVGRRRELFVIAGVLVCALGLWLSGHAIPSESLITMYRDAAQRALNADDLPVARVAARRLMQLDRGAAAHRFISALLHESTGELEEAERIVRDILESDGPEFPPAHRWLADRISRQRAHVVRDAEDTSEQSVSHLESSTRFDPTNVDAHIALAEAYLARRSPAQAIRELEQVVDSRPDLRLTLAQLAVIAGRADAARIHGDLARDFYQNELDRVPLAAEPRLRLAASLIFLEEFSKAAAVLLKGWEQTEEDIYRESLGTCYLVWHDVEAKRGASRETRLSLLEKSLSYAPDHIETLKRIALMATEEGQDGPAVRLLMQALADRPIPADVHLVLGTNAYRHGRAENAIRHLEEAYRLDPDCVETLNNYALVLSKVDGTQLERALELSDKAVHRRPNLASVRETRGQILARMGRWTLAVADLENALQVMRGDPAIHETLAQAYHELGDDQLAAEHRRLARQ